MADKKRASKQLDAIFGLNKSGTFKYGGKYAKIRDQINKAEDEFQYASNRPITISKKSSRNENFNEGTAIQDERADAKEVNFSPFNYDNALHQFATYNTILTLSGLAEAEVEDRSFLTNPVHDIIARTGGIVDANVSNGRYRNFQPSNIPEYNVERERDLKLNDKGKQGYKDSVDVLNKAHDIFFENINILSTVGPNSERGLANFTKIEFEMHEPFGTTLTEKIRAATFINGYEDYQDAPLLLTMEFKGFDEKGQPTENKVAPGAVTRKFPIVIARVEFELNEGGTRYSVTAVPLGDMAHDDRFKFPKGVLNVTAKTIEDWCQKTSKQLFDLQKEEIRTGTRQIADEYEFVLDERVTQNAKVLKTISMALHETSANVLTKLYNKFIAGDRTTFDVQPNLDLSAGVIDDNTSLVKYFEDAIRVGEGYQALTDAFWLSYAYMLTEREDLKPIKTGTLGLDTNTEEIYSGLRDYYASEQFREQAQEKQFIDWFEIKPHMETRWQEFDNIRKVHPKRIIYKAIPKKIHVLKFIRAGISLGNIDWGKYVKKNYDYLYTGTNVDVQNLKIFYKSAYYLRNLKPHERDPKDKQQFSEFEENLTAVFGQSTYPEPNAPIRQEPSVIKGRSTMEPMRPKSQQFYDYLTNPEADMLRLEMDILGDPIYICQDQFTPIAKSGDHGLGDSAFNRRYGSFNSEYAQPLIRVNFRVPDDIDVNTGLMFEKKRTYSEDLWFSGIYQLTKVESRINNGEFTQTLFGVRLNNQSGENKGVLNVAFSDGKLLKGKDEESIGGNKKGIKKFMDDVEKINNEFPV